MSEAFGTRTRHGAVGSAGVFDEDHFEKVGRDGNVRRVANDLIARGGAGAGRDVSEDARNVVARRRAKHALDIVLAVALALGQPEWAGEDVDIGVDGRELAHKLLQARPVVAVEPSADLRRHVGQVERVVHRWTRGPEHG